MEFIKGVDLSSLLQVESLGGKFRDGGEPEDVFVILKRYGINSVRLRLWNDPYDEAGNDYGGGVCDLPVLLTLARRARQAGMKWMLDLQYSDFWADPGVQTLPKAWRDLDFEGLVQAVYRYTRDVLRACRAADVMPELVQVGNEITAGLLWPFGQYPHWENATTLLRAGAKAVREEAPDAKVVIHLDHGGKNDLYREWFDRFFALGGDCDVIGLSFYPCWHGKLKDLVANMNDLAVRYGKEMVVVEAGTAFTSDSYASWENLEEGNRVGPTASSDMAATLDYPMTLDGQMAYTRDLITALRAVPGGKGKGFFWWEPCWLPVPGTTWATRPGWEAIGKEGPGGNSWANQTLFDFDGNALPTLRVIQEL